MFSSLTTRLGLLALLLTPVLAFSPMGGADDGDGDETAKCNGCVASGNGAGAWQSDAGGYVKVTVQLKNGICDWSQEHNRCLEADCQTSGTVQWYLTQADTLTLPDGTTFPLPAYFTGNVALPITKVDCGSDLAYTASCSLGSFTVNMNCTECE